MFLKRIAEKLGVFHIVANYVECDSAPQAVVDSAAYLNSVLTVLSIEMTEKALPVVPGVLARINAGVELVAPVAKWYARLNHAVSQSPTCTLDGTSIFLQLSLWECVTESISM